MSDYNDYAKPCVICHDYEEPISDRYRGKCIRCHDRRRRSVPKMYHCELCDLVSVFNLNTVLDSSSFNGYDKIVCPDCLNKVRSK
jgi:hypothetical protein